LLPVPSFPHAVEKRREVNDGTVDGAAADFVRAIMRCNAHCVETAVERFKFGLSPNAQADARGNAVLHVDRGAHGDFTFVAVGL